MRMIGKVRDAARAQQFGDYLLAKGIQCRVDPDPEPDGSTLIWVYNEEQIEAARRILDEFESGAEPADLEKAAAAAQAIRAREKSEHRQAARQTFTRQRMFPGGIQLIRGRLTTGMIIVSVVMTLISGFGRNGAFMQWWYFFPPLIFEGQLWRIITPIFLHGGMLHVLFNMLWLYDLGNTIELKLGTRQLVWIALTLAVASNLGQYLWNGPYFVGMSGVVYGLLGYVWIRGKFDPWSGIYLHPQTVTFMLVWYLLCVVGLIPRVANMAHTVGLILGMALGYLAAAMRNRR